MNRAAKMIKSAQFENCYKIKTDQFIIKNIIIKDEKYNINYEDIKMLGKL